MLVTKQAIKNAIIGRSGMTFGTQTPFSLVLSAVNGKVLGVVIERRRRPGCLSVTGQACSRELSRCMRRVCSRIVIR